jgi:hypothetical protein
MREAYAKVEDQEIVRHILHVPLIGSRIKRYPDGERRYVLEFRVTEPDGTEYDTDVTVTGEEFTNVNRMSNRLLDILGRVLSAEINPKEWKKLVNRMLAYMEVEDMGIQDSDLAQIYEIIRTEVSDSQTAVKDIDGLGIVPAVIIDGRTIVTSSQAIERKMMESAAPLPSRREIGEKLRRIGFTVAKKRPRINEMKTTVREMSKAKFDALT